MYYFIGIVTFIGLLLPLVLHFKLKRLIRAAEHPGKSEHPLIKVMLNKFTACYKVKVGVNNVDNFARKFKALIQKLFRSKNYPQLIVKKLAKKLWIMWINYFFSKFSPIFTTFPAPIVINKSPSVQFSNKYFSVFSKLEK